LERSLGDRSVRRVWTALRLVPRCDTAARTAAHTAIWMAKTDDDTAHDEALGLVNRLIAIGCDAPPAPRRPAVDYADDPSAAALADLSGRGLV
jgi:hypothetical protein